MSNLVALPTRKEHSGVASDAPGFLRQLADDIEKGEVSSLIVAYVQEDQYRFLWPSSNTNSLTLATLAQARAVARMLEP